MPGNHHLQSQKQSRPTADPILNGFQLPQDLNFRRLYDSIKIMTADIKELQTAIKALLEMQPVSPFAPAAMPEQGKGVTEQNLKRTQAFDILKRVSTRL